MSDLLYKKQRWRWLFRHRVYVGEKFTRSAMKWHPISDIDTSVQASWKYFYFPREIIEWLNDLEGRGVLGLESAYRIYMESPRKRVGSIYAADHKFAVDFHRADHASLFKLAFHGRDFSSQAEEHQWCIVGELR